MRTVWLDTHDLAERYRLSPRTIELWRAKGTGPRYAHIGCRALYLDSDVADFESARLAASPHNGAVGAH